MPDDNRDQIADLIRSLDASAALRLAAIARGPRPSAHTIAAINEALRDREQLTNRPANGTPRVFRAGHVPAEAMAALTALAPAAPAAKPRRTTTTTITSTTTITIEEA